MPTLRVVLVDDDDHIRLLALMAFADDDRFVVVGEGRNGAEAVTLASRERPDIVLLDLELPGLDGAQAVPLIRDMAPESFIVLWTGAPDSLRAYQALALGASAVIDKGWGGPAALTEHLAFLYSDLQPVATSSRTLGPRLDVASVPRRRAAAT